MKLFLRWLLRALLAALGVGAVLAGLAWYLVSGSLPDYDGPVDLAGLEAPVEVIRDANAIPHIRATTEHDTWFALGAIHAQDRLWQMELSRRAAQGRLSALFGNRTLALDRMVKTLNLYGLAGQSLSAQSPEVQAALQSYADGVNAWIRHVNTHALGRGAPELFVFGDGLSPWTPADSLAILKMMALRLSGAARSEVRRARFLLALPPERVRDILPEYPNPAATTPPRYAALEAAPRHAAAPTLPSYAALHPGARFAEAAAPVEDPWMDALGPASRPEFAGASNAWAVDGSRTSSGKPLLASDPHLWLSAPSLWYLVDLQGPGVAAMGGTLPGAPPVLIGRNRAVGWGLTTAQVDDQDLYIERVNPDDPNAYKTPDGWAPFQTRTIRIEVAGEPTLSETVRSTRHGPVLSHDQFGVTSVTPEGHVAALAWTALAPQDRTMTGLMGLMRAESLDQGMAAADLALAPAQNVLLADRTGVGMVVAGAVPDRNPRSVAQGRIPSPGWAAENDWLGIRAAILNPRILRPTTGAVANANNRTTDAPYPANLSFDWDAPYRIQRLEKELSSRAFHSRDTFVALQNDAVSEMARSVLPLIARDLWWRGQAPEPADPQRARALTLLANWTGEMDQHSPEPLIFSAWMLALTRRLAADELGPLFPEIEGPQPLFVERVFRNIDGAGVWCDVDKTPQLESCADISQSALDDALAALTADWGSNIDGWRWGAAHVAEQAHAPFGYYGPLGLIFSIRNETSGGNYTLLRGLSPGRGDRPFQNVHAAGLRVVYDFADLDRSVMMISTGESGHPFSRWYDHLATLWARGDTIPMSMDDADARTGSVGTMALRPGAP